MHEKRDRTSPRGIKVALGAEVVSGPWTGGRMSVPSFWTFFSFVIWAVSSQGNDKLLE